MVRGGGKAGPLKGPPEEGMQAVLTENRLQILVRCRDWLDVEVFHQHAQDIRGDESRQ